MKRLASKRFALMLASVGLGGGLASSACDRPAEEPQQPMGVLPSATTTAQPLWIPFSVRAGETVQRDPREGHIRSLRRLTRDGKTVRAAWFPDGRAVLIERADRGGCGQLVKLDLGSGREERLSPEGGCASHPSVRRDGTLVFAWGKKGPCGAEELGAALRGDDCDVVAMQAGKVTPLAGGPELQIEPAVGRGGFTFFSARKGSDFELMVVSPEGQATRLTDAYGVDGGAALSPDGTRLAWHASRPEPPPPPPAEPPARPRRGAPSATPPAPPPPPPPVRKPEALAIHLSGPAGQHPRALPAWGKLAGQPAFLIDSRRIVFASDYDGTRPGDVELYLVDPDAPATSAGHPPVERITFSPGYDGEPRVSPDGTHLLFVSERVTGGQRDLFLAELWEGAIEGRPAP